jgi:hypothetical protein
MPDDDIDMGGDASTPTPLAGSSQPQLSEKAKGKWKRVSPPASPPGDSRRKRRKPLPRAPKPKKPSDWHIKRKELPPNAEATKVCMFFMVIMFHCLFICSWRLKCIFVSSGSYHTKMRYLRQSPKMTGCASVIDFPLPRL